MKKVFIVLSTFLMTFFSFVQVQAMDVEKDALIIEVLTAQEFANELFKINYKGNNYPVRFISNPKGQMLYGKILSKPVSTSLIVIGNVPVPVARYIEDLILEIRGSYDGTDLAIRNEWTLEGAETIHPVHVADNIKDSINDEIIHNTFHSDHFVNQVIHYHLDNKFYQVRLLHNPDKRAFSETKKYKLSGIGVKDYTFSWNSKYAILFDSIAPGSLTEHLYNSLRHLSYWDWYYNYTFSYGTYVLYEEVETGFNETTTTTWKLDTWFDFTENFE